MAFVEFAQNQLARKKILIIGQERLSESVFGQNGTTDTQNKEVIPTPPTERITRGEI